MLTEYQTLDNPMVNFRRQMGRFLSEMGGTVNPGWPFNSLSGILPASNIWENNKDYFVEVSAPGITPDDVNLSVLGNELTISIHRPAYDETVQKGKFLRQERMSESSNLGISLPTAVNVNGITANMKNGVLLIQIPKTEEAQARKITVNK